VLSAPILRRAGTRAIAAIGLLVLLVLGGLDLGARGAGTEPNFNECLEGVGDCIGRRFSFGSLKALSGGTEDQIPVKLTAGTLIRLQDWPAEVPYPAPGMVLAASGIYVGEGRIAVDAAEIYPLAGMDMLLGLLGVGLWITALFAHMRRRQSTARAERG